MIKNLVAVAGGGALAFALAGAVSPAVALGSVHPAGVAHTKLINPAAPPTIRDSSAQFSHRGPDERRSTHHADSPTGHPHGQGLDRPDRRPRRRRPRRTEIGAAQAAFPRPGTRPQCPLVRPAAWPGPQNLRIAPCPHAAQSCHVKIILTDEH